RVAVLAETPQQLLAALQERHTRLKRALPSPGEAASRKAGSLAFLCSCEGAEYAHMGRELYETYPVFRNALNRCSILVERTVEQSLLSVLYPAPEMQSLLHEYRYRRVATFALDYALALLWRSWGVTPGVLAG